MSMMTTLQLYRRSAQRRLEKLLRHPRLPGVLQTLQLALTAFTAAAASLGHWPQTLPLGLLCAVTPGARGLVVALAGGAGYLWFWPGCWQQGLVWMGLGLAAQSFLGTKELARRQKLLMCAVCALLTSLTGLWFAYQGLEQTPVTVYFLRVVLSGGSCYLFAQGGKGVFVRNLRAALGVLALAQVVLPGGGSLGYFLAAGLCVSGTFPACALAGLALDLAQVSPVPMTGVFALAFLWTLVPIRGKWWRVLTVPGAYLVFLGVWGLWDPTQLGMLCLGSLFGLLLPQNPPLRRRRGETAVAQVRLELASGVLEQTKQVLQSVREPDLDEQAVLEASLQRCCDSCPCRKDCAGRRMGELFSPQLLRRPYIQKEDLPNGLRCRKEGRLLSELRRGQEQLRHLRRERLRLQEYRDALARQYGFLQDFLRELSDSLVQGVGVRLAKFTAEAGGRSVGAGRGNGDCYAWFAGVGSRYYVLLCDGMGTGEEAGKESRDAVQMLKRLLQAGLPADCALSTFNDLCILRGMGGCSTVDLAELYLDSGKAVLYKWGAAPSYLVEEDDVLTLGQESLPPGLRAGQAQTHQLPMNRGQVLVLTSDGLQPKSVLSRVSLRLAPEELAALLLNRGRPDPNDDATAVVIRLRPC